MHQSFKPSLLLCFSFPSQPGIAVYIICHGELTKLTGKGYFVLPVINLIKLLILTKTVWTKIGLGLSSKYSGGCMRVGSRDVDVPSGLKFVIISEVDFVFELIFICQVLIFQTS